MPELFPATRWTLLARAKEQGERGALARNEFAEIYRRPIRDYLEAIVRDPDLADELTQDFFSTRLVTGDGIFDDARRERGSFRALLKTALRHYVTDYHRKRVRGEAKETHPDQWEDRGWDSVTLQAFRSAEAAFHRAWVEATLMEALAAVREICRKKGQLLHLALFESRYLSRDTPALSWEALGGAYGLDQKTARTRADTVARHFRFVLRRMLRQQVTALGGAERNRAQLNEAAIDREIHTLLSPIED